MALLRFPLLSLYCLSCAIFSGVCAAAQQPIDYNVNFIGASMGVPGNATFDYIVVGGGTAGLTIATRLAQNASNSVAVVEAGGFYEIDNGNLSVVPSTSAYFTGADINDTNPLVDWSFVTTPQPVLLCIIILFSNQKLIGEGVWQSKYALRSGKVLRWQVCCSWIH